MATAKGEAVDERGTTEAVLLMRALVEGAKERANARRAREGPATDEDVVGATVVVTAAEAYAAGIDPDTPRYYTAVAAATGRLLQTGALERDREGDRLLADVGGNPEAFKITADGIDLLRRAKA